MELCTQLNYVRSLSAGKAYFYYLSKSGEMCPLEIDRTRLRAPKVVMQKHIKGASS